MNPKTTRLFFVLMILILASLACATLTGGTPPAPPDPTPIVESSGETTTPTSIPEATEPTPSGGNNSGQGPTAGADSLNLDDASLYAQPAGVNTYRASLVFTFSGTSPDGTPVTGSISGEGAFSLNPSQMSFTFQTSTSEIPLANMEIIQVENTLYMTSPDLGCFSLPVDAGDMDNPYEEMLDTGGFLKGQATRVQPDETINDIPVYVYEITSANLDTTDPTTQQVTEITSGRLYVSKEGGYIVRLVIDGRGQNTLLTEANDLIGDVHYELNYFDHNQPVNIAIPDNCAGESESGGGGATGSFPVPDDATDLFSMTGITTFSSSQTVEDLTTFYKTEMVADGWTMGEEISLPGLVSLTFTREGKTATVTITADPATGKTQVAIFEG